MTLDEMLALLPDNTTGEISAADLRAIVTDLHALASAVGQVFPYLWANDPSPGAGKVNVTPWDTTATFLSIAEVTDDGQAVTFGALDMASSAQVRLIGALGSTLDADITGPSGDQGGYRNLPIAVTGITGPAPTMNEKLSVLLVMTP